jgi:hypothetical protein
MDTEKESKKHKLGVMTAYRIKVFTGHSTRIGP